MTGRRSHGRLSALNGVVHQGTKLPDKLIPALWITRDVNGYIMSIGSILRFNDD